MRLLNITASSLFSAGLQQGQLAQPQIQTWLSGSEMSNLIDFALNDPVGNKAFRSIRQNTTTAYPELVTELEGMAEGADIPLDYIWVANMIAELNPLLPATASSHCTDVYAHDPATKSSFHGHNEDWSVAAKPLWFYVSLTPATPAANFAHCAGFAYPGSMIAYAPAWNAHGIYQTQNTLFPNNTRDDGGLACSFVQRAALCSDATTSIDAYLSRLHTENWASGASLNVVDANTGEMANAEVLLDDFDVFRVKQNYTHTNEFKHLQQGIFVDDGEDSATHRQARLDEMDAPASLADIAEMLGDTKDGAFPVYRDITLSTNLLDVSSGILTVWDGTNAMSQAPTWQWNIITWFQ